MKIAIFGTGTVGATLGGKLVTLGHEVMMGSRTRDNPKALAWVKAAGGKASQGTFAEAAAFGEIVLNATAGAHSLAALQAAGARALANKILIDASNPLDFSKGMPPTLTTCNTDSVAEQLQRAFPDARVVKALNTTTADVMVDPSILPGETDMFISGNDAAAKAQVTELLGSWFGWKHVHDLGDITAARGQEMFVIFWVRLYGALGTPRFNLHAVVAR
jgi:predicted dinucleotide-binding enzyme